jgi:hypothetical protein
MSSLSNARAGSRLAAGFLQFVAAGVDWNPNGALRRFALVPVRRGGRLAPF